MLTVNKTICTEADACAFVRACEEDFQNRLHTLVSHIVREEDVECITLSGPTCSGKTTMANKLTEEIAAAGKCAVVLSIDDFFKDRIAPKTPDQKVDYDSVSAIDLDCFAACVDKMLRGENTLLPRFDFITGTRAEMTQYVHTPNDIIVFEGIQAVYPEVVSLLSGYPYTSIFIAVTDSISVNGTVFAPEEIRLARRIVRDYKYRSATPEFTFHVWESVRENEEKNIFPYMHTCKHHINSLLPYEPFMIAPYLVPLLESVPIDSPYFTAAMALREKYRCVEGSEISDKWLPANSLYHEFLG